MSAEDFGDSEPMPETPPIEAYEADDVASGTTDEDLAQKFSLRHAEELRYVAVWDRWLLWDGCRWKHDDTMRTWDLARALCREASSALPATATQSARARLGSAGTVYALLKLARVDRRHAVAVKDLDSDPWLLNTPGGVVNLRNGAVMPHEPSQLHTKITNATPNGECPVFLRTLERVLPDPEVRNYLQRLSGYALTALSRDHIFPFFWGGGRNGKGTVLRAVQWAMGEYAVEISAETLMESVGERHQTEMTPFFGARLVVGSEISAGKRWNEARIKLLTGGDPIAARYCAKDPFTFDPSHTLIVMGNNRPGLRNVDEAIRRRVHLVRFAVTIPESECDPTLGEKLRAEAGGILAWALRGVLEWQRIGIAPPPSVQDATAEYLKGEDNVESWLDECCERRSQITLKGAFLSYRQWADRSGVAPLGRGAFADALEAHGFMRAQDSHLNVAVFQGLTLKLSGNHWSEE